MSRFLGFAQQGARATAQPTSHLGPFLFTRYARSGSSDGS